MFEIIAESRGHHFVGRVLGGQSLVFDVGANLGEFAEEVVSRWGLRCISVEANSQLCRNWSAPSEIVHAAISSKAGEREFYLSENSEGSSLFHNDEAVPGQVEKVRCITLDHLLKEVGGSEIDLLKLDVEGAEIEVLSEVTAEMLANIKQITVEFHDFCLPQITAGDVERVKKRLSELGFWSVSFSRRSTDVLFINSRTAGISKMDYLYIRYLVKNYLGLRRVVKRYLKGPTVSNGRV